MGDCFETDPPHAAHQEESAEGSSSLNGGSCGANGVSEDKHVPIHAVERLVEGPTSGRGRFIRNS